jgi:macrolide-specific efflux system membrane fusion protein
MPQMSAQVFFVIAQAKDALVAPLSALLPTDRPDVFRGRVKAEDGSIKARDIRIGVRDRLNGEALSGLKENEALVTGVRREKVSGRLRW